MQAQLEQQIRHLRELTGKLESLSSEADRDIETSRQFRSVVEVSLLSLATDTLCVSTLKSLQVKYRKDRGILIQERNDVTDVKKASKALKTNLALMAAA